MDSHSKKRNKTWETLPILVMVGFFFKVGLTHYYCNINHMLLMKRGF
jgi:hypothetical protein